MAGQAIIGHIVPAGHGGGQGGQGVVLVVAWTHGDGQAIIAPDEDSAAGQGGGHIAAAEPEAA